MKDKKGYLKKLEGSMKEKLFFVEHLDLNNKIIVDFGCANAALIKHLMAMGFENTTYIGIERDEDFFNDSACHCQHYLNRKRSVTVW